MVPGVLLHTTTAATATSILLEPGGYRKVGRPRLRWLDYVTDLARFVVRNWRRTQDRELWRKTNEEAKALLGLLSC
jgi:hypothetical protein